MARREAIERAREWLHKGVVVLDTETTGRGDNAEPVEIAAVAQGRELLNTLVRPTVPVEPHAQEMHGIEDAELVDAPTLPQVMPTLLTLSDLFVVTYNFEFDQRIIRQGLAAHGMALPDTLMAGTADENCVMLLYAEFYGEPGLYGGYRRQSQENALHQCGLRVPGLHRALADAQAALVLLEYMAAP